MPADTTDYELPEGPPEIWEAYHLSIGENAQALWNSYSRYRQIGIHMMHGAAFSEGIIASEHWVFGEDEHGNFYARHYGKGWDRVLPYGEFLYGKQPDIDKDTMLQEARTLMCAHLQPITFVKGGIFNLPRYQSDDPKMAKIAIQKFCHAMKNNDELPESIVIPAPSDTVMKETAEEDSSVTLHRVEFLESLQRIAKFIGSTRITKSVEYPTLCQDTYIVSEYLFHFSKHLIENSSEGIRSGFITLFASIDHFNRLELPSHFGENVVAYLHTYADELVKRGDNRAGTSTSLAGSFLSIAAEFYHAHVSLKAMGVQARQKSAGVRM